MFGCDANSKMPTITLVYIVAVIFSILFAFLLAYLARLSSQGTAKDDRKKREDGYSRAEHGFHDSIKELVAEEISEFVDSRQHRQMISNHLAGVFDRELVKRVSATTQELEKKYDVIIGVEKQNGEITRKKYKKVLEEKTETEAVIRSIAEGLVVVDAQGKVLMMNPAAERLLGISRKDKVGKSLVDNLQDEQLVSLLKSTPENTDKEIELTSQQDETKKVLRASTAVVENESGQTVGMVSVLSDITKQKEVDQLKSNFIANISHELRTPLVAIDKSISLLLAKEGDELSATQDEFLSIAKRNLKRLTTLINDLLDLAKLEGKKMSLRTEAVSVESVINECIDSLNIWANTKFISLKKNIQEGLPPVNIDPLRVGQVLTNLLGNAIKFTPNNGTITLEARFSAEREAIQVGVQDTGIGIAKEDLSKVFYKFYQTGERISTDISGTGIGLSIAKEVVELHGGTIWAESEKGRGAKFIFTLPLK